MNIEDIRNNHLLEVIQDISQSDGDISSEQIDRLSRELMLATLVDIASNDVLFGKTAGNEDKFNMNLYTSLN